MEKIRQIVLFSFQYFQTLIIRLNIFIPSKKIQIENVGSISQFLAKELQNLVDSNITDTTLFFQDNSIYYSDNGQIKLLWKSPLSTEKNGVSSFTKKMILYP